MFYDALNYVLKIIMPTLGATSGAMDAGNLLKPMLGRGELRCIGATTFNEYRKYIEKDPALERRYQQVYCGQPSVEDKISILRGLRERYELHHGVKISDSALVSAAVLADRYITECFLPDKAIDHVDEAAAKLKMEITSKPTELDEIDRAVLKLEMEKLSLKNDIDKASKERLSKLENDSNSLKQKQKELTEQWDHEKALMTRIRSIKEEFMMVSILILYFQMMRLKERLRQKKIDLHYTKEAVELLGTRGFDLNFGARPVKRVIQQLLENEVAMGVLRGDFKEEYSIIVDADSFSLSAKDLPLQDKLSIKKLESSFPIYIMVAND
ncbi:hypothetical protein REPUB_Repub03eG0012200 [Reevesia pubescens]